MNNNKIKTPHDFPSYLTGDVKIVTPAQEQLNELQWRVEMVRSESDTIKELYNEVAEQQNSTPETTNEAVDSIVADAVMDGAKSIESGAKEAAIAAAIAEVSLPGDQPKTTEQLEAIAVANIDSTEAVVSAAEQAGVDTDEVARELQEKEHERKIKPELFSDGVQLIDRKPVVKTYDGYVGGYDHKLYKEYYKEAQDLMAIPEEQRLGTEIIDEFGEARCPIIDIELLDEEDVKDVQEQVNLRKSGFNKIEEFLLQVGSNSEHDIDGELAHQVADIALKHDIIRPDNQERLTTIADLYISETDVRQMQQIDEAMHDSTTGKRYVTMATERVVGLAQYNVLCSGTVMVHSGDYIAITESGGLSPRSMREGNGAQKEGSSSGGLIHFTGDSTRCFYGDSCFGITIDAVVKKTPYLFYEPGIVIDNNGQGHSNDRAGTVQKRCDTWRQGMYGTSQRMSRVVLGKHGGRMPKFVQARLDSAATRAAEGLAGADIGIGQRNNFSFAASEDKETAANYTYELSDDLFTICRMGDDGNVRAHVDTETVFMPVSYKQVNFSEKSRELNEVGMGKYEFTLENLDKFNKGAVVFWAEEIAEKAGFSEEAFRKLAQHKDRLSLGYSELGERFMSEFGAQKYLTLLSENEDRLKYLSDTYAIARNESDLLKKDGLSEGDIADLILRSPDATGVEEDTLSFASEFVMSSDVDDGIRDIVVDRVQALPGEQRDKLLNRCYLKFMLQGSLDESFPFSEDELIHAHERVEERKKQDENQDVPKKDFLMGLTAVWRFSLSY
ncbi:MAG: hypothetical protein ACFNNB_00600 [Candidatus Saccharimonas sp.]|jgi:hypothetical protein